MVRICNFEFVFAGNDKIIDGLETREALKEELVYKKNWWPNGMN